MKISFFRILIVFIFLQPFVNSITGLMIKYGMVSIFGPLFYITFFIFVALYSLNKYLVNSILLLIASILYFIIMVYFNKMSIMHIGDFLKLVLPVFIFLVIKNLYFSPLQFKQLGQVIVFSISIYCLFVVFSFLISFKMFEGKGYYGFIYSLNDFILLLMFSAFIFKLFSINYKKNILLVSAFILSQSKALLVFIPFYAYQFMKKLNFYRKIFLFVILVIVLPFIIVKALENSMLIYFSEMTIIDIIDESNRDYVLSALTGGRTIYLDKIINYYLYGDLDVFDYIFGLGQIGSSSILDGKVGVEMDIIDGFVNYGIVGLGVVICFYYFPVFLSGVSNYLKILFSIIIAYSMFGGHFINNPLVGSYYGIILGLLFNKYKIFEKYRIMN